MLAKVLSKTILKLVWQGREDLARLASKVTDRTWSKAPFAFSIVLKHLKSD